MNQEEKIDRMTSRFLEEKKHIRRQCAFAFRQSVCDKFSSDIVSLLRKGASIYAVWQYLTIRRKLKISYSTVFRYIKSRNLNGKVR